MILMLVEIMTEVRLSLINIYREVSMSQPLSRPTKEAENAINSIENVLSEVFKEDQNLMRGIDLKH